MVLTVRIDGHVDVLNGSISTKNLSEMIFVDSLRELFYDNLHAVSRHNVGEKGNR